MSHRYAESVLFSLFILSGPVVESGPSELTLLTPNDCGTCIGHQLVYECTTIGPGSTVWTGTAFHCRSKSIVLSHSLFNMPGGTEGSCNNGGRVIVGHSRRAASINNSYAYTSQLNVTVDASMSGETVKCVYNDGASENAIGNNTIIIREEPFPPPDRIHVADIINVQHITFRWSSEQDNCPALQYSITAIDCGICPELTMSNQVTCQNATLGEVCSFAVNTIACGSIVENPRNSVSVTVTLNGPSPPNVHCVPLYCAHTGYLKAITTSFVESESFTITTGVDGSATSYTIMYSDSLSGTICSSATISANLCEDGTCNHLYQVSNSSCPPCIDINITVFATNILGNGATSDMITIRSTNQFIKIEFDTLLSSVQCTFTQPSRNEKSCSIRYGPGEGCTNPLQSSMLSLISAMNSLMVEGLSIPYSQNESKLCFIVTASDGPQVTRVEGTFMAGCDPQQLSDGTLLPGHVRCGPPLHSLGLRNGMVCYSGTRVGDTAVYTCSSCGYGTVRNLFVRTCLPNGHWNGSTPQCECNSAHDTNYHLITMVTITSMALVFVAIISTLITMIIILVRAKSKVQTELKDLQNRTNVLYDEIGSIPPSIIDSNKNIAYVSVMKNSQQQ